MKKILTAAIAGIIACTAVSAQSISLTNTFGANDDTTDNGDFLEFNREKDDDGDYKDSYTNGDAHVDNRLQLDFSSEKLDGRLRMEIKNLFDDDKESYNVNGKNTTTRFRGFVRYKPLDMLNLSLGNEFFTKIAADSAYLGAADDTPKWGRMAQSGFAVTVLPIEGLKAVGGIRGNSVYNDNDSYRLDFGAQYAVEDLVTVGATAQSVTNGDRTFGIFAGLNNVENLLLNIGFIYNAYDTDFIPAETKYALSLSAGYEFKEQNFAVYADVVSGLNNEYISSKSSGSGYETSEYTDDNDDDGIPFQAKILATYGLTEDVGLNAAVTYAAMLGQEDAYETEIYPYLTLALPQNFGDLDMGVRMTVDSDGLTKFAIPFSWSCKFINKK